MDVLHVDLKERRNALIVSLSGSAGVAGADHLERAVRLVKVRRPRRLIIDLAGLSFIASLGLGMLIALSAAVKSDGGTVRFASASPAIAGVIKRCRLEAVLPVYASVDEAMNG